MYGSDRSFLQVIEFLVQSRKYKKITVVLPTTGPLLERLASLGVDLLIMDLSLLSKTHVKRFRWGKIFFPLLQLGKKASLINTYDVLYVNTSVILDFYLLGRFLRLKKIIHIREIPGKFMSFALSVFIRLSNATVIFNSQATKDAYFSFKKSYVIHNSFEGYTSQNDDTFSLSEDPLRILLIGRVNDWKGQDFAISALRKMAGENFILRIVGGTSIGNEHLLFRLKKEVMADGLGQKIVFDDFCGDPEKLYRWSDLVIVPSRKPEPFGRIAIEAMSVGKPLVVANHGGLKEIVDECCGTFFIPNDEASFRTAILKYIHNRQLLKAQGEIARDIYENRFSIHSFHKQLERVFTDL
jgi:glycosyltransferase involved in cell wall biosynthesis